MSLRIPAFEAHLCCLIYFFRCRYLLAIKCEAVSPALEMEIKSEESGSGILLKPKVEGGVKTEGAAAGILLKPKQEVVTKSANQILREQHGK